MTSTHSVLNRQGHGVAVTTLAAHHEPVSDPRVVFVAPPRPQILDLAGPIEVFAVAAARLAGARYRTELVSADGGETTTSSGVGLATTAIASVRSPIDTLIVSGGDGLEEAFADAAFLHHVRRLAAGARRVASVCTGSFILAEAGLLDGRRAATHWEFAAHMANTYPNITVDADAIYVHDGKMWTSAGISAGIDLALALIADDHGEHAAAVIARHLVVYLRRSGGQAQFSAPLSAQAAEREPLRELLSWIVEHIDHDLTVAQLARQMNLSERQFTRVFKENVGTTPAEHVETVRLEAACRLLETTSKTAEQIAKACGYGTPETLHRAFRRRLNTTPMEHRRHFSADT
jgi:transcriptional regulator GlxA family with amidase domain